MFLADFSTKIKANGNKFGLFLKRKNRLINYHRNFVKWRSPSVCTQMEVDRGDLHLKKILMEKYSAIFFLQEKSKFIGICFNFGRDICKKHVKFYLVRWNLQILGFWVFMLTNAGHLWQSNGKQLKNTRMTPKMGLNTKSLIFDSV